ncbi:hypothetical protein M3Y94_00076400 [Aphelenchoides besseyi]|nr:hypothetical protein M3Y94_00076400 [Aphelenchoides besseyi]KAI6237829.1 Rhomboid domain-containing protein [Aphelenchoides besseyi]
MANPIADPLQDDVPTPASLPPRLSMSVDDRLQSDANGTNVSSQRPVLAKSLSNPGSKTYSRRKPQLRRAQSIREKITLETHKFFGVPLPETPDDETPRMDIGRSSFGQRGAATTDPKWQKRRFRHLRNQYDVKTNVVAEKLQKSTGADTASELGEPLPPLDFTDPQAIGSIRSIQSRRGVPDGRSRVEHRDSVAKIAYNTLSSIIQGNTFRKTRRRFGEQTDGQTSQYTSIRERNQVAGNRSFPSLYFRDGIGTPTGGSTNLEFTAADNSRWPIDTRVAAGSEASSPRAKPPIPEESEITPSIPTHPIARFVNDPETPQVEIDTFSDAFHIKSPPQKTSTARKRPLKVQNSVPQGELFFDLYSLPTPTSDFDLPQVPTPMGHFDSSPTKLTDEYAAGGPLLRQIDEFAGLPGFPLDPQLDRRPRTTTDTSRHTIDEQKRSMGFRRALMERGQAGTSMQMSTIEKVRAAVADAGRKSWRRPAWWSEWFWSGNESKRRRPRSMPIFGKFKRERSFKPEVVKQLENDDLDYRPFFTYWITTVQIVITIFSLFLYGIGTDYTAGFGVIERSGDVLASTLSSVHIVVFDWNNIWIGPRFADLVHMGAKFTPCMRPDIRILNQIEEERRIEATQTGCCIGPDQKCFQTSTCPKQFATFTRWSTQRGRKQPVVCGQDPRYCTDSKSYEWGQDISKWPKCQRNAELIPRRESHMHCELAGRPCCIQMHGQCRITTKEYCDFVQGYYHANATLCSQVSCLNDVCGMSPFLLRDTPDQFYRFFIPLFIHAGIIRLLITVILQLTFMRRFELMIGWIRLSLIYFVSGVGGYLASASFVPYMPEVGPAGSQGGVLGALIINVIYNWNYLKEPRRILFQHLAIAAGLFITGLLPFIDNWAQLFGFVFGILMAAALIPYIEFGKGTRLLIVLSSLIITGLLFTFLVILFYGLPVLDIPVLSLFNCPFIDNKVCDQQGLILRNWLPI